MGVPAKPTCGSLDCLECVTKRRARIKARVRPSTADEIPGVPRFALGMEPPPRPWPWERPFFAETPANGRPKSADFGGSDGRAVPSDSARQKAWERIVFQVAKRDGYRCQRCLLHLRKPKRSVHHIVPRDEGGGDHIDNLILLCHPCHDAVEIAEPPIRNRAAIEGSLT